MNEDVLSPAGAIQVYRELLSDERVRFEAEPLDVETAWFSFDGHPHRERQHLEISLGHL